MLTLGILSLIQAFILPGYLILRNYYKESSLSALLFSVPVSLAANHFCVYIASLLGIYSRGFVLTTFALEVLAFVYFEHARSNQNLSSTPVNSVFSKTQLNAGLKSHKIQLVAFFVVFVSCIFLCRQEFFLARNSMREVFSLNDAVSSWNPWGVHWFKGHAPHCTWGYPQMLPILYSLTYQFIGTSQIEFFAHSVPAILLLLTTFTYGIVTLFYSSRPLLLTLALYFYLYYLNNIVSYLTYAGYADAPLSIHPLWIVSALSFYESRGRDNLKKMPFLLILGCSLSNAALTKQGGLILALLVPLLFRESFVRFYGFVGATLAPWFFDRLWAVHQGLDASNAVSLFKMQNPHLGLRFMKACELVGPSVGFAVLWNIISLATPAGRSLFFIFTLPYFVVWALTASYSPNNLALDLYPMALGSALGVEAILRLSDSYFPKISKFTFKHARPIVIFAIAIAISFVSYQFRNTDWNKLQYEAELRIRSEAVNRFVYGILDRRPEVVHLYTNDAEFHNVPRLRGKVLEWKCDPLPAQSLLITFEFNTNACQRQMLMKTPSTEHFKSGYFDVYYFATFSGDTKNAQKSR